jgi:hypothetical protein
MSSNVFKSQQVMSISEMGQMYITEGWHVQRHENSIKIQSVPINAQVPTGFSYQAATSSKWLNLSFSAKRLWES